MKTYLSRCRADGCVFVIFTDVISLLNETERERERERARKTESQRERESQRENQRERDK